ncbi:MAG: protein adenylyltransferase SelO [Halorhodospira sp.]
MDARTVGLDALPWQQSYAALPERLYRRVGPRPAPAPGWVRLNHTVARSLRIDPASLAGPDGLAVLAGNRVPAAAEPLAQAYAGHQFGHFVPQLGDGRALLLGELTDSTGIRRDVQLKGSGPTPFSRGGDGRAPIGPVIREYLGSEALAGLGVATTRALAAVTTGGTVYRWQPEPGGVLARVAASHLRVGTFEYAAARGDDAGVRALADYALARHYPDRAGAEQPYQALLQGVAEATADLVADWMLVGFIHGVMNTDNLAIAGETLDYGPFGFMDAFDPATVYSSIDTQGRYAYDQQPVMAEWDLARLAEALLPLLGTGREQALARAHEALACFRPRFEARHQAGLRARIGLAEGRDGDDALVNDLLRRMAEQGADWTLTFRRLSDLPSGTAEADGPVRRLFQDPAAFDGWAASWRQRLAAEVRSDARRRTAMRAVSPAYTLRNHLAQWAVDAATERLDLAPMGQLLQVLAEPYADHPGWEHLAQPPRPEARVTRTFCGT